MWKGKVNGYEKDVLRTVIVSGIVYFRAAECAAGRGGVPGNDNL